MNQKTTHPTPENLVLRKGVPEVFTEGYDLTFLEQTIIIELHIMHGAFDIQLGMPMVDDLEGTIEPFFQKCLEAFIETLGNAGLITEEFYREHAGVLDGYSFSRPLSLNEITDLYYNFNYMLNQYLIVLGHNQPIPKHDKRRHYNSDFSS